MQLACLNLVKFKSNLPTFICIVVMNHAPIENLVVEVQGRSELSVFVNQLNYSKSYTYT